MTKSRDLKSLASEVSNVELVCVGQVGRPRGLKGELLLQGRDEPLPLVCCYLTNDSNGQRVRYRVSSSGFHGNKLFVRFDGVSTRTLAESLTGTKIYVRKSDLDPLLEADEYYWDDLIGVKVKDGDGLEFAEAVDVYNVGASDIVVLKAVAGYSPPESKVYLELPLIDEYFDLANWQPGTRLVLLRSANEFVEFWVANR